MKEVLILKWHILKKVAKWLLKNVYQGHKIT
jgi:hypothetical protein